MKVFLFMSIILFQVIHLVGAICLNDIAEVYPDGKSSEIEAYIIDGAEKFLSSYSDSLLLMKEYEISSNSSFNSTMALLRTESALKKLEESRSSYAKALEMAENVPYVKAFKDKLESFNYEKYINDEGLNTGLANEVTKFLNVGDVKGLYIRNLERIDKIIEILSRIKSSLNEGRIPIVNTLWYLLQNYSETALFGNYSTILAKVAFSE